ncbi:MAG: hypothetical protein QOK06_402 [Acidimicrobiaceae bacterium]
MAPDVRARNRKIARRLGYPAPPEDLEFPHASPWRTTAEVVERALVVNVVLSCAHGLPVESAATWLGEQRLVGALTAYETEYLDDLAEGLRIGAAHRRLQVEALWALLWALSFVEELDFGVGCGERVTPLVPNLFDPAEGLGPARVRAEAERRDPEALREALDLARCVTWGLGDADLSVGFSPGEVEPYVVWERRRALEWLHGADWDEPGF